MRERRTDGDLYRLQSRDNYIGRTQGGGRERSTYIQSLKVFAHFEHELLGAFLSLGEVIVGPVRLWQREERYGRRSEGEQASNVLRSGSFG